MVAGMYVVTVSVRYVNNTVCICALVSFVWTVYSSAVRFPSTWVTVACVLVGVV